MAFAEISFGGAMGGGAPVYAMPGKSETITTSGSNAAGTQTAGSGAFCRITARGGNIYIAVAKTAATAPRVYIPDGATLDIGPLKEGDIVNAIDVV